MKIASYNMAQTATSMYHRQVTTTFESELVKAKQSTESNEYVDYIDEVLITTEEDEKEEAIKAKNDLIDSLMAYLDRRQFNFEEVPYIKPEDNDEKIVCSDENQLLSVDIKKERDPMMVIRTREQHEVYETESMQFTSTGQLTTEAGQTFEFSYDMEMNREFYEKNSTTVEKSFIDPLILNLDNKGVSFSDKTIQIDLDLDGKLDTFNMLNQGNGFLVLDKDENGKVNDGSELFGPRTNNGFGELRAYDLDNNEWIDENDVIFNNLKIWTLDEDGKETLININETEIGAIYLGKADGKFDYKDGDTTIARITGSSIYLREDGSAGAVHEILV